MNLKIRKSIYKFLIIDVLMILIIFSSSIYPAYNEGVPNDKSLENQVLTKIDLNVVNKYIYGTSDPYFSFNSISTNDNDEDITDLVYDSQLIPKTDATGGFCPEYSALICQTHDLNSDLESLNSRYVYQSFGRNTGETYLQIDYPSDHLSSEQRENFYDLSIGFGFKLRDRGSLGTLLPPEGGKIKSSNLRFEILLSTGASFQIWSKQDLYNDIRMDGVININDNDIIQLIKDGAYIEHIQLKCNIYSDLFGHYVELMIDYICFNYYLHTNYRTEVQYNFQLPDYDLDYLTELEIAMNYSSGAVCTVSVLGNNGHFDLIPDDTYDGKFTVPDPKNHLMSVSGVSNVICIKFSVQEDYISEDRKLHVNYIELFFDEDNPPAIENLTPAINELNYINYIPNFEANLSDKSGIKYANVTHVGYVFDLEYNESLGLYKLPITNNAWFNYYNGLLDGQYQFIVQCSDEHDNEATEYIDIVKDTTDPILNYYDMPEVCKDAPVIALNVTESNLESIFVHVWKGSALLENELIFNGSHYVLDNSCANWSIYEDFWDNLDDGEVFFNTYCHDKAENENNKLISVIKDKTAPKCSFILPHNYELLTNASYIWISIEDDSLDINSVYLNANCTNLGTQSFAMQYDSSTLNVFKISESENFGDWVNWDTYFKNAAVGEINLTVFATDLLGQKSNASIIINKIDATPPLLIVLSGDTDWHNDPVYVSAYAEDYNLDQCWYEIDSNPEKYEINNTIPISTWNSLNDGYHMITICANDTVNNVNSESYSLKIDRTAPEITSIFPNPLSKFNSPPMISVNISDIEETSDLTIYYMVEGYSGQFFMQNNTQIEFDQNIWDNSLAEGYIQITINVTDSMNFSDQKSFLIKKDVLLPTIHMITANYTTFYEEPIDLLYTYDEPVNLEIKRGGNPWNINDWTYLDYGEHEFDLYFVDTATNVVHYSLILNKADSIDPVISINYPQQGELVGELPPMFSLTVTDLTLYRLSYTINQQTIAISYESSDPDGDCVYNIVFTIDEQCWDDAYNETVSVSIFAIDEYGNNQTVEVLLLREDYISMHSNEGLNLGLFVDMPWEMISCLGGLVGISLLIQYSIQRKRRTIQ